MLTTFVIECLACKNPTDQTEVFEVRATRYKLRFFQENEHPMIFPVDYPVTFHQKNYQDITSGAKGVAFA